MDFPLQTINFGDSPFRLHIYRWVSPCGAMETLIFFAFIRTCQDTGTVGRARGRDLGGHSPGAQRRAGLTSVHLQLESLVDHLELMGLGGFLDRQGADP